MNEYLLKPLLDSPNMPTQRPVIDRNFESNIRGLYIIGDLSGAPVVKIAMEQGANVAEHIAAQPDAKAGDPDVYDILVIGAGAAGLNASWSLRI